VANAQGADLVGGEEGLEVIGVGGVWRRGQRGTEGGAGGEVDVLFSYETAM
jgi:hypothetical protein